MLTQWGRICLLARGENELIVCAPEHSEEMLLGRVLLQKVARCIGRAALDRHVEHVWGEGRRVL